MMPERKQWGEREAATLRSVRAYRGHSQADCAKALRELGAIVGQGAVSGWETGKHVPHSEAITAIELYCNAGEVPPVETSDSLPGGTNEFNQLIRSLTGEPALSDRQGAAVDALIVRLRTGPPLTKDDRRVALALLGVLGIHDQLGPAR